MQMNIINNINMKEQNKRILLKEIRKSGNASRKDLALITGLTTASVTNLVRELLEQGLVVEGAKTASSGGRRAIELKINPHAGYIIGLDLNSSEAIGILCDFSPEILDFFTLDVDFSKSPDEIIEEIIAEIKNLIKNNNISKNMIFGIGVASAGPYDRENNLMINPPNFTSWSKVPLTQKISAAIGIDTYFEKETSAITLAEYYFGNHSDHKRMIAINAYEIGIGGGFVIAGDIYHGNSNTSMEIGHVSVDVHGEKCPCGGVGCLEIQADSRAILRYANSDDKNSFSSLDEVVVASLNGNYSAKQAIAKSCDYISDAISNISVLLSPDIIYIGGPLVDAIPGYLDNLIAGINKRSYPDNLLSINKVGFTFGKYSAAMGGVAVVYYSLAKVQ